MDDKKYLYGVAVQGIQGFIFQTDKLKEIVGASELVEEICTTAFDEYGGKADGANKNSIVRAAGNIKHIFDSEDDCKRAVREFPRKVMTMAPGITVSQAVVTMAGEFADFAEASNKLEQRLRAQRNKPMRAMNLGLMAISRAPSTGFPAVDADKDGLIDEASVKKVVNEQTTRKLMEKMTGFTVRHEQIAYNLEDIADSNSWLAVIHADGNGMGMIVQKVCQNQQHAKIFSTLIDEISKESAQAAFEKVVKAHYDKGIIPIRPVILGGDDLTVICRADLAVRFTQVYMEQFETISQQKFTQSELKEHPEVQKGLTVCAGIAFIKSSYPFHYAVDMAESLCGRAKKAAKKIDADLAPSCLMFHKVDDSFVEEFDEIVKRKLKPQPNLSFEFGPYYCGEHAESKGNQCENTIQALLKKVEQLKGKEGSAVKSHIRQWLGMLFENVGAANQMMKRMRTVDSKAKGFINVEYEEVEKVKHPIPFYDIISLASLDIITDKSIKEESK